MSGATLHRRRLQYRDMWNSENKCLQSDRFSTWRALPSHSTCQNDNGHNHYNYTAAERCASWRPAQWMRSNYSSTNDGDINGYAATRMPILISIRLNTTLELLITHCWGGAVGCFNLTHSLKHLINHKILVPLFVHNLDRNYFITNF